MRFEFATAGRIVFGAGSLDLLRELAPEVGARPLLVVGARSARESGLLDRVGELVEPAAVAVCEREPTVEEVDRCVEIGEEAGCDLVLAVGGGSVLDCGKAAAAMLTNPGSLVDYLEGDGLGLSIDVPPRPMIAVPTTAGTGSEVTKNAVISGSGYKKSVRSDQMIPDVALIDPDLLAGAPREVIASCGLDALTQLVESYLSVGATPFTDGLALRGIRASGRSLQRCWEDSGDAEAREGTALASLLGGVCLANAGLGAVHGFASPVGALFPIGHGACCAALLVEVCEANLEHSRGTPVEDRVARRFADMGEALGDTRYQDRAEATEHGLARLRELREALKIPGLGELGISEADLPRLVAGSRGSSMRYNPIELTDDQLTHILQRAI